VGSKRDGKLILFGVLNVIEAALVGAIPLVVPARSSALNWTLGAAAVLMLAAAPALVFGGRKGRRLAVAACLVYWVLGLVFAALIFAAASYLYGLYGRTGQSAAAIAFVVAAMVLVLFWLIPGHEIHFLKRRSEEP
jgi:hypothetical protein